MSRLLMVLLLGSSVGAWAQSSSPAKSTPPSSAPSEAPPPPKSPDTRSAPPRSDRVNADDVSIQPGESSSKDSQIDLSPPSDDAQAHPRSAEVLMDEGTSSGDVSEIHPWNPHKAAKDVEVGDFYFKRKNYRAAQDRYREALLYKENDAIAIFRLAVCLEKMDQPDEARKEYENYLKILPQGPESEQANKALARLKGTATKAAK